MSHWFHRNPLKATAPEGFALTGGVLANQLASKICSDLRLTRSNLLTLLCDPNSDLITMENQFKNYMALLQGFMFAIDAKGGDSKLRYLIKFKWTNSMLGLKPHESGDTWFEALHICFNMALWYTKHAAKLAGLDEVKEEEAKEVHRCLRKAAGIFEFIKANKDRLGKPSEEGRDASSTAVGGADMDTGVLTAYVCQSTAEAQEVTVARAIELKHNALLVAALSHETALLFQTADTSLANFDPAQFDKWRKYLQLKAHIYVAYSLAYLGESVLAEDKCGEAIRACKEALQAYGIAEQLCELYSVARGPGRSIKPEKHLFFRRIKPIIQRHLEKAERENGFIYHQKVPDEKPELPTKATHGLASPETFELPTAPDTWTPEVYATAFDVARASMPDFKKAKKDSKELPPVKEQPVYQTEKDQSNSSGCNIS